MSLFAFWLAYRYPAASTNTAPMPPAVNPTGPTSSTTPVVGLNLTSRAGVPAAVLEIEWSAPLVQAQSAMPRPGGSFVIAPDLSTVGVGVVRSISYQLS